MAANPVNSNERRSNALDPRIPNLVQPWKRMVEEGLIVKITVDFTPTGVTCVGKAGPRLAAVEGAGLNETDTFPLGVLLSSAELGKLITKPGKKTSGGGATVAPPKPAKSLCKGDLTVEGAPGLQARINEIARNCGGGPLVGRVRSAGKFSGAVTESYQSWWDSANGDLRALSLSVGKKYSSFTEEEKMRLLGLQCPFRGTLEFQVAEVGSETGEGHQGVPVAVRTASVCTTST